jgi:hypothetical protein
MTTYPLQKIEQFKEWASDNHGNVPLQKQPNGTNSELVMMVMETYPYKELNNTNSKWVILFGQFLRII